MMPNIQKVKKVQCPYCWEFIEILVDCSVEEQAYIEDCQVCCRPINFEIIIHQECEPVVILKSEDE
ncbi:CPXCG motif-containing cysteine-rich protein [Aliikangiella sp. IMCC44359]|uniref:CPXCG motif-containing cysteine-rich protein n=1 Tax=Aliikangiella sp. IMCC44359 TaxID=3459125 RepID=UPI00403AB9FA